MKDEIHIRMSNFLTPKKNVFCVSSDPLAVFLFVFFFYDLLNSEKMLILQSFISTISTQLLFKQTAIRVRVF